MIAFLQSTVLLWLPATPRESAPTQMMRVFRIRNSLPAPHPGAGLGEKKPSSTPPPTFLHPPPRSRHFPSLSVFATPVFMGIRNCLAATTGVCFSSYPSCIEHFSAIACFPFLWLCYGLVTVLEYTLRGFSWCGRKTRKQRLPAAAPSSDSEQGLSGGTELQNQPTAESSLSGDTLINVR